MIGRLICVMYLNGQLLILLTLVSTLSFSQAPKFEAAPTFAIKGRLLVEGTSTPVEFATVSVFNRVDSSLSTGGLTDLEGVFNIPVKPGSYYLNIQFMGFQEVKCLIFYSSSKSE